MSENKTQRRMSRRDLLKTLGTAGVGLAGAGLLNGCAPAATPAPPPTAAPAATQAPAPTATIAVSEPKKLTVWMAQSFTKAADEAIKNAFLEWGKAKGVEVEYDLSPSAQMIERVTPALEAGRPPDMMYLYESQTQWFRAKGVLLDVTDVVEKYKNTEGGYFTGPMVTVGFEGKYWATPVQINPWVMHARQDLLDEAKLTYPKTWEEFAEVCRKIQKPPELYGYGMCLGRNDDNNCNFLQMLHGFGGKLQNEDGTLAFKSQETVDCVKFIVKMYNDGLIPPGAINWDNSGNNKAYQSKQVAFVINPSSVYAWCRENDQDLMKRTRLYNVPAGPKGSYGLIDSWAIGIFKATKSPNLAKDAAAYFIDPKNYINYIVAAEGRAVPIYKNMMNHEMWKKYPEYAEFKTIAETGRVMGYAAGPTPAAGDVFDARILADMIHRCIVEKWDAEKAVQEAYDKMAVIYKKYGQFKG